MQVAVLLGVQPAQLVDQVVRAWPATGLQHRLQRFMPLPRFQRVGIEGIRDWFMTVSRGRRSDVCLGDNTIRAHSIGAGGATAMP